MRPLTVILRAIDCTPYLLNLGLTKSQTSLVWIAGPLSGIITQPIVGVLADSNRSKWGRRRPYIAIGTAIVSVALLTLGWTREIVAALLPADSEFTRIMTIFVAVMALYVTDFAINAGKERLRPNPFRFALRQSVLKAKQSCHAREVSS